MKVVGNKVKGRILKRKTNTRTCAYQGVRNVRFSENLSCVVFLLIPFRDSPFRLITDELRIHDSLSFNTFKYSAAIRNHLQFLLLMLRKIQ